MRSSSSSTITCNPSLNDEGIAINNWGGNTNISSKSQFVSMDSILSPSYSTCSSSSSVAVTTPSSSRRRGAEEEELKAAAARAINQFDKKSRCKFMSNEIHVSDDEDTNQSGRLFSSSEDDIIDLSLLRSLQSRTPLRGLPCEADRKRIMGALAIILASSYLYDDDGDTSRYVHPGMMSYSKPLVSSDDTTTAAEVNINPVVSSESSTTNFYQQPTPTGKNYSSSTEKVKASRLNFSIELLHQCTHLLFLDPSHAKALEPILYIRPTPTIRKGETTVDDNITSNNSNSAATTPKIIAATPQRQQQQQQQHIFIKTPKQNNIQTPPPQPSIQTCTASSSILSPVRLTRYGLLSSPYVTGASDETNSNDQTLCKLERVDIHPLQPQSSSGVLSSSLFCTFSHASSEVAYNSPQCHNYNYNSSHPEEESFELLRKIKEGLLSSSFEQQDSTIEDNPQQQQQQHVTTGGFLLAQHQSNALDGFRELVLPFLSELTNEEVGYDCVSLLLLHYLLANPTGYDARVRFIFKRLAVLVLVYTSTGTDVALATRKFEAMERVVSEKILLVVSETNQQNENEVSFLSTTKENSCQNNDTNLPSPSTKNKVSAVQLTASSSKEYEKTQLLRTLKITTASLAAGTVFALTGGLAAPGIAAGMAALTSSGTSLLLPHGMLTTMFGVGGGGLIGYKVQRRTKGLTQFNYKRAKSLSNSRREKLDLHTVICLSGWIRDSYDFYRPWGIPAVVDATADGSRISDFRQSNNKRQEDFSCYAFNLSSLIKFYDTFKPENVHRAAAILQHWEGEEQELWRLLRVRYGTDPFSFMEQDNNNSAKVSDTPEIAKMQYYKRSNVLDILLEELGYGATNDRQDDPTMTVRDHVNVATRHPQPSQYQQRHQKEESTALVHINNTGQTHLPSTPQNCACNGGAVFGYSSPTQERSNLDEQDAISRLSWDYFSLYDGELYTVVWEENLLMELCDSVTDMALDIVEGHIVQILRQTALHSFMNAIALPFTLVNASNMIDETWTLTIERAEEAGKELAKSLLGSQAGNKPVILMGYSMGARVIYSCLKELAKHQEKWESEFEEKERLQCENGRKLFFPCRKTSSYSREPASIVEDAVLMGCPNHISLDSWKACRRVVAGRLINCYSHKDLILSFMFQIKRMTGIRIRQVCGTRPVNVQGVENYDVTHLVSQHSDYSDRVEDILNLIGYGQPSPSTLPIPFDC